MWKEQSPNRANYELKVWTCGRIKITISAYAFGQQRVAVWPCHEPQMSYEPQF